jgi:hypothetical protein
MAQIATVREQLTTLRKHPRLHSLQGALARHLTHYVPVSGAKDI